MALKVGDKAPDFTLDSTSGSSFSLEEDQKGKSCILYFYPKDFTPGCTQEACDFRDHFHVFKSLDIEVFGISTDSIQKHLEFKEKYQLPFDLLTDNDAKVAKRYKAAMPLLNMTRRITYLLDKEHNIAAVYENLLGAGKHIDQMVRAVK